MDVPTAIQAVPTSHEAVTAVGDDDFQAAVLDQSLPVLVDFWAPWCPPCRVIAPRLEQLSAEYAGRLAFAKLDTDLHTQWAARLGIRGMPTLVVFHGGAEVARVAGPHPGYLKRFIEETLAEVAA